MGYYVKTFVGAVLVIGALVAFNVALINLLKTGTCASGNTPYEIARPCPAGTGTYVALLIGSIFGGLIGAGIFAFRGDPPGKDVSLNGGISWGLIAWGLGFGVTGVVALVASFTGDLPVDGKTGGIIVGITFALMGLPVLAFVAWDTLGKLLGRDRDRPSGPASGSVPAAPAPSRGFVPATPLSPASTTLGGGDNLDKLARLDALRKSGALTDAEFDKEKAKLLSQG